MEQRRSHWQLPPGVEPGTWEYAHRSSIADDYDTYFADHELFGFDRQMLESWLPPVASGPPRVVADLGCGTARALFPLIQRGYQGLAIDLSPLMLENVRRKAARQQLDVWCLCANLAQLEGLKDESIDDALCLFSTLGMIKGRVHRRQVLRHTARILRPRGRLFLHVHNLWCNLLFPGGLRWLAKNGWRSWWTSELELGDKYYPYRGLNNMFLHVFRRGEIRRDLREAGFSIRKMIPLAGNLGAPLPHAWWLGKLRASGWWIVAQKDETLRQAP